MYKSFRARIKKHITTPDFVKILLLRTVGNFLILISIFTIGRTFYEPIKEELRYLVNQLTQKRYVVEEIPQSVSIRAPTVTPSAPLPTNRLANLFHIGQTPFSDTVVDSPVVPLEQTVQ